MIFVTVGTGSKGYDPLIRTMDDLAPNIAENIIAQTGHGIYAPKNIQHFKFAPSLTDYYNQASMVVTTGGVGTLFELLHLHKKILAVGNNDIPDKHQSEILDILSRRDYIVWCKNLADIKRCLDAMPSITLKKYIPPPCCIDKVIAQYLRAKGKWSV